jgi:methyl-accepting chemotaxis protein
MGLRPPHFFDSPFPPPCGAGFAVVAGEVRNLAMRAAEAARNTATLIEGTVKRIQNGSEMVRKTNEAFGEVASESKKISDLVGEVSAACHEQSQGIEQINKTVAEMDRGVQQNAANAEEMTAQAEAMKGFVGELAALIEGSGNGNGSGNPKSRPAKPLKGLLPQEITL